MAVAAMGSRDPTCGMVVHVEPQNSELISKLAQFFQNRNVLSISSDFDRRMMVVHFRSRAGELLYIFNLVLQHYNTTLVFCTACFLSMRMYQALTFGGTVNSDCALLSLKSRVSKCRHRGVCR